MQTKNQKNMERPIISFEIDKHDMLKLAFIANRLNTSIAELLRRIVREYLRRPEFNTKYFVKEFLKEIEGIK